MAKTEIVIIGNIAMEQNTDCFDNHVIQEGGSCLYAAYVAASLQKEYALVTKLSKSDEKMLNKVWGVGGCLYTKYNGRTAAFENHMPHPDREVVETLCLQKGAPFQIDDIPEIDTYVYYFAGDIYGDFPIEMQPAICEALESNKKIGVFVNESLLLSPSKSVTAIIGIENKI